MRIAHTLRLAGIAGAELYLQRLLPALAHRGHDIHLVTLEPAAAREVNTAFLERLRPAVSITRLGVGETVPGPFAAMQLAAHLRAISPDVVNSHLVHADLATALAKVTLLPGLVLVSTKHGYREVHQARHGLDGRLVPRDAYWSALRLAQRVTDGSFAVSEGLRRLFCDAGLIEPDRISVIPHGIERLPPAKAASLPAGSPRLLVVGRLNEVKGHRYALDAVALLARRYPAVHLFIAGTGPLEAALREQVTRLGIARHVSFLGFRNDVRELMAAADVVVVPSVAEGFGLVVLEAFSTRSAVVAFDAPAINEIIVPNESGLLAPPGDAAGLAEVIARLADSPRLRQSVGERGFARLETEYTVDVMAARTLDFYRRVLRARAPHA